MESGTTVVGSSQTLEGMIPGGAPIVKAGDAPGVQGVGGQGAAPQSPPRAPRQPVPLMPNTFDDVFRMADALIDSSLIPERWLKGCMVEGKFSSKVLRSNLILALGTGVEIGLSPLQSLRELYVVHGHVAESVLSKLARVQASPVCEKFDVLESTDQRCIVEVKRVGQGIRRHEYTIEDAKTAGLFGRNTKSGEAGNWEKRPRLMLRRRAIGEALDEVFADIIKGIGSLDDIEEEITADKLAKQALSTVAPPVAQPPAQTLRRVDKEATPKRGTKQEPTPPPASAQEHEEMQSDAPASSAEVAPVQSAPVNEPQVEPATAELALEPAKKPERAGMKKNPDWDDDAKALFKDIRASTSETVLNGVAKKVAGYTGPWRQDLGRALSDQRAVLKGGGRG